MRLFLFLVNVIHKPQKLHPDCFAQYLVLTDFHCQVYLHFSVTNN